MVREQHRQHGSRKERSLRNPLRRSAIRIIKIFERCAGLEVVEPRVWMRVEDAIVAELGRDRA